MTDGGGGTRTGGYLLVLVLAVLAAVWGSFLVPLRLLSVPLPVSVVVALAGNYVLCTAGGRLLGRWGAVGPGAAWFVVVVVLQGRRPEGDLVVPGTAVGLLFLLAGSLAAALAVGLTPLTARADEPAPVSTSAPVVPVPVPPAAARRAGGRKRARRKRGR